MTKLPATFAEAEASLLEADALNYARETVRRIRDEKISFFGLPLSWFEKAESRRFVLEFMKQGAKHPSGFAMMDLANYASAGWDLADDALRELYIEYEHRNEPMPPPLRTYIMERADPRRVYRRPRGQKKSDNLLRDIAVTVVVGDVCMEFGLKPTRQTASKHDRLSGCRIAAQALKKEGLTIAEPTVVSIWTRYGRIAFPSGVSGRRPL